MVSLGWDGVPMGKKGILRQIMVTFKRMPGKGEFGDRDFTTGRRGTQQGKGIKNLAYRGTRVRITSDFSSETMQARKEWNKIFQVLKEKRKILTIG